MIDESNAVISLLLKKGFKLSVQVHFADGRGPRWTVIALHAKGKRVQGWGRNSQDALNDLSRRSRPEIR